MPVSNVIDRTGLLLYYKVKKKLPVSNVIDRTGLLLYYKVKKKVASK